MRKVAQVVETKVDGVLLKLAKVTALKLLSNTKFSFAQLILLSQKLVLHRNDSRKQ